MSLNWQVLRFLEYLELKQIRKMQYESELRGTGMNSRELLRTRLFCCIIFFLDYRGKFEYFLNFSHHKNPLKLTDLP